MVIDELFDDVLAEDVVGYALQYLKFPYLREELDLIVYEIIESAPMPLDMVGAYIGLYEHSKKLFGEWYNVS